MPYNTPIADLESFKHQLAPIMPHKNNKPRLVLKNGHVIDPKNGVDAIIDIALQGTRVSEVAEKIIINPDDRIIDCQEMVVLPGLIDIHLHLGDLFNFYERPIFKAARDGVTLGLSPGAGNSFMAPALVGAEVDRGLPIHTGVFLGAAAVLGAALDREELIGLFTKKLDYKILGKKLSRNAITNSTAHLTVGIKDHMGHFIMPDNKIDSLFEITSQAHLIYMSHTQDPEHATRMAQLANGRPLHLAHATAAGCGTHGNPLFAMKTILGLVDNHNITAEFVSSMLLRNRGRRDGLRIDAKAQELAYQALHDKKVDIVISDGQSGATMKGFGHTSDNLPCIFTLSELGVLSLKEAVATMTSNPARFLSKRLDTPYFENHLGHLGINAFANVTVTNQNFQHAIFTIVNGVVVSFEGNLIREGLSSGCLVSKFGLAERTGIGDLTLYAT